MAEGAPWLVGDGRCTLVGWWLRVHHGLLVAECAPWLMAEGVPWLVGG